MYVSSCPSLSLKMEEESTSTTPVTEHKPGSKKQPLYDFTGSHPEDAALYEKMPPPGDDEEQADPEEWMDILGSGRLKKKASNHLCNVLI